MSAKRLVSLLVATTASVALPALAQDTFDGPLDPRTAAMVVDTLREDPAIAAAGIADDGTIWTEPTQTRSAEELEGFFLRASESGRDALRAWLAGGRAPELDEGDRILINSLGGGTAGGDLQGLFGWDARSIKTFEGGLVGWADQVLADADGTAGAGAGAGLPFPSYDTPDTVYRYSCCEGVDVLEHASGDSDSVATLERDEAVVVKRLMAPGIAQVRDQLEACLPDNCGSIGSLLNDLDLNVYAEVKSLHADKEGWVPLVALFTAPRSLSTDRVRLQVGYNRVINALDAMVDQIFWPDNCGVATKQVYQDAEFWQDEDHFYDLDTQDVSLCDIAINAEWSAGHDICNTCRPIAEAIFGEGQPFNAQTLAGHELADDYAAHCGLYLAPEEVKTVTRTNGYNCGEYPFGETHYDNVQRANDKLLVEHTLWNRNHRVTMGRSNDQRAISFNQYDMAANGVANFQAGNLIGARNLWFSLMPIHEVDMPGGKINPQDYEPAEDHKLLVHICGHLPGNVVDGPLVDYHWRDTWGDMINKIDFGQFEFDRLDFCALAKLSMSEQMVPSLEFTEVTEFALPGANIGGIKITYAAWVYIFGAPILGAVAVLGGHIGSILATLVAHLAAALPLYLNISNNDEWVLEDLLPESLKIKLTDGIIKRLNDATTGAMSGIATQATDRLETLCDVAMPALQDNHPLKYFYDYLRGECESLVLKGKWVPFSPHGRSSQQGCYGTQKFFSPAISGSTDDYGFSSFSGQDWYTGGNADSGCRLEFQRVGKMDDRLWETVQCLTATVNLHFNGGETVPNWNGFLNTATQACGQVAVQALGDLYGDGADLLDLIDVGGGGTINLGF